MAVAPVFDLAIPAPDSTSFTNGERALGVAATVGGAANGTYYLSRFISLPAGVYSLKVMLAPGGSITIAGVTFTGSGLVTRQIDMPAGQQRINITLTKAAAGDCYAALLIHQTGKVVYASSGTGWVFNTAALADGSLTALADARLALPVFGVMPNWANGLTERINYLTDVMVSETDVEQRRSLREFPRRSFEASFLRSDVLRARLDHFFVGIGRADFLMPLWHEQYRTTTGVASGEAYQQFPIVGDTLDLREFAVGDLVLITSGDPVTQEIVKVASVNASTGRLTWVTGPTSTWPIGTRLIPLRRAMLSEKPTMSDPVDRVGTVTVRFDLKDPMTNVSPDWGNCCPLWKFKLDWASAITMDYDRASFTMDNDSGPVEVTDPGKRAEISTRVNVTMRGRSELLSMRQFIAAARGKAVRFYAPSFTRDLIPVGDISGTTFDCETTGFGDMMVTPQWGRKIIEIRFDDGSPSIYRTLVSVVKLTTGGKVVDRFTMDSAVPSIALSTVERLQFIVPSRFDQDGFEFSHLVDGSAVARAAMVLRSTDGTGMPTLDCMITTPLYPLESIDTLDGAFALTAGRIAEAPKPLDLLDASFQLTAGDIRTPLHTYNEIPEGMDASFQLDNGVLRTLLLGTTVIPEGMDAGFTLTAGELRTILLSTTVVPEGMDAGFVLTAGTLV